MKPELEKLIDERTQEIKQIEVKVNRHLRKLSQPFYD